MAHGPQFVQWFGPVLDALRAFGGRAKPKDVCERVAADLRLSDDVRQARTPSGQHRFENQVAWARFYLVKAGLVHAARTGWWELTEVGRTAYLDLDSARELFSEVHQSFRAPPGDSDESDAISESNLREAEGIEGSEDASFGLHDYPIDSLLIRSEQRTVQDVVRRIDQGRYIMDPDFQREFLWKPDRQSRLIESVLMRIPLPVFYLAETADGKLIVVDGLQRLSTFHRFLHNELPLQGTNPDLDGKKFKDLPAKLQNRIEDAQLMIYLIDSKVPERARLDIFERVNSGVPLTRQQMRNALYQGKATALLRALATDSTFLDVTDEGLDRKGMRDREAANRFCAFYLLGVEKYADLDGFLAEALRRLNRSPDEEINQLKKVFILSMNNNRTVFGEHAFRRYKAGQQTRSMINMSLFDVESVIMARYPEDQVQAKAEALRAAFFRLMDNEEFRDAISLGTSDKAKVKTRFAMFQKEAEEVLGAP